MEFIRFQKSEHGSNLGASTLRRLPLRSSKPQMNRILKGIPFLPEPTRPTPCAVECVFPLGPRCDPYQPFNWWFPSLQNPQVQSISHSLPSAPARKLGDKWLRFSFGFPKKHPKQGTPQTGYTPNRVHPFKATPRVHTHKHTQATIAI